MTLTERGPAPSSEDIVLTLNDLLARAGLDPADTLVLRHRPPQRELQISLPEFAENELEVFEAYQAVQGQQVAAMMKKCGLLASFIGMDPGTAIFAGIWRVRGYRPLDLSDLVPGSALTRLTDQGVAYVTSPPKVDVLFDLERLPAYTDWRGRLDISWPSRGFNWKLRAEGRDFPVRAIHEESRFSSKTLDWERLSLTWRQLQSLPLRHRELLRGLRGVYYIFDERRALGYVGSATGADNMLGRWTDYATSGHGGNKGMAKCDPESLRFSILQRTDLQVSRSEVLSLEMSWMQRLRTREHGLNRIDGG